MNAKLTYLCQHGKGMYGHKTREEHKNDARAGVILLTRNPNTTLLETVYVQGPTGKWSPPKGHLEEHDTSVLSGALRELREETGIVLEKKDYPSFDLLGCRFFLVKVAHRCKLMANDKSEIKSVKWFPLGHRFTMVNRHVKILHMIIKSIVYWYRTGIITIPKWVSPHNVDTDGFELMLYNRHTQQRGIKRFRRPIEHNCTNAPKPTAVAKLVVPTKKRRTHSEQCVKWCRAEESEADDASLLIKCKYCKSTAFLMKIHQEGGDYVCKCGGDYSLNYFCYKCRNNEDLA